MYSFKKNIYHSRMSRASSFIGLIIVGHTHEDVEQMWVSVHNARKCVPTLPILQDLARQAYHPIQMFNILKIFVITDRW